MRLGEISKHDSGVTYVIKYDIETKNVEIAPDGNKTILYKCYPYIIGESTREKDDIVNQYRGEFAAPARLLKKLINA